MEDFKKEQILHFLDKIKTPSIIITMKIDDEEMKADLKVENLKKLINEYDVNPLEYIIDAIFNEFVVQGLSPEDRVKYNESKPKIS